MKGPATEASYGMLMAIHAAIRRDFDRLIGALDAVEAEPELERRARGIGSVVEFARSLAGQLEHHHTIEDDEVWPQVRSALGARATATMDAMESEHQGIVEADAATGEAINALVSDSSSAAVVRARDAVRRQQELVLSHLSHEEADAVPLMFELDEDFWAAFQARRQQDPHPDQFLPWVFDSAPAEAVSRVTSAMPPPVRDLLVQQWLPARDRFVAALPKRPA